MSTNSNPGGTIFNRHIIASARVDEYAIIATCERGNICSDRVRKIVLDPNVKKTISMFMS